MADHIKIGDITPRVQYSADGTQTGFTYPFPIFTDGDVQVFIDAIIQTITTQYTVSGAGNDTGGTVTFVTAPANGTTVTLVRDLTVERSSDFQESGEFRAKVINDELDKIIAMVQETDDALARTLHQTSTDASGSLELPEKTTRANKVLGFDVNGDPVVSILDIVAMESGSIDAAASAAAALVSENSAAADAASASASASSVATAVAAAVDDLSGVTNAPTARSNLGLDGFLARNLFINGGFDIWQRGTSVTSTGGFNYGVDRFTAHAGNGAGVCTASRVTISSADQATYGIKAAYAYQHDQTTANATNYPEIRQKIEGVQSTMGQTVTLSGWFRTASGTALIKAGYDQNLPTYKRSANFSDLGTATTTWQYFTTTLAVLGLSGETISSGSYLAVYVQFPQNATYIVQVAELQLELGSVATSFEHRPPATELALCQRYFCKTFPLGTAPAQNVGFGGSISQMASSTTSGHSLTPMWFFPVPMRVSPTVTLYSTSAATGNWWNAQTGAAGPTANAVEPTEFSVRLNNSDATGLTDNQRYRIHATADAEL